MDLALEVAPVEIVFVLHLVRELVPAGILVGVVPGHESAERLVHSADWDGPIVLAEPLKAGSMHGFLLLLGGCASGPFIGSGAGWILFATDSGLRQK